MIYDAYGSGVHVVKDEEVFTVSKPKKDLIPAPGQVIVLRNRVETSINGIDKPIQTIEVEERFNIKAIVARVGAAVGAEPWFAIGDEIILTPHAFTEVVLDNGDSVWLGPWIGIKAKFVEVE